MPKERLALIVGNWKMNKTPVESLGFVEELFLATMNVDFGRVHVVVCPPFTSLTNLRHLLERSPIQLGAQNVSHVPDGPMTGEVSARMLAELCTYVIIGHSERRANFAESNEIVNQKIRAALGAGLIPIVCVGETRAQKDAGKTWEAVETQLRDGLAGLLPIQVAKLILAYEPVWAISRGDGRGQSATVKDVSDCHSFIRSWLDKHVEKGMGRRVRILYGGSSNPQNAAAFIADGEVDGFLVGGASLNAKDFAVMISLCEKS